MTEDIQKLDKVSDIKTCEVCKCLTCRSGKMFNSAPCPNGNNCTICNGKSPNTNCKDFQTGF